MIHRGEFYRVIGVDYVIHSIECGRHGMIDSCLFSVEPCMPIPTDKQTVGVLAEGAFRCPRMDYHGAICYQHVAVVIRTPTAYESQVAARMREAEPRDRQ